MHRRKRVVEEPVRRGVGEGVVEPAHKGLVLDPEFGKQSSIQETPELARRSGRERRVSDAGVLREVDQVRRQPALHRAGVLNRHCITMLLNDHREQLGEGGMRMQDRLTCIEKDDLNHRAANASSSTQTLSASAARSSIVPLLSTTMSARCSNTSTGACAAMRAFTSSRDMPRSAKRSLRTLSSARTTISASSALYTPVSMIKAASTTT